MLEWDTGVIGLPLRLLAREVYARVVEKVGAAKVALITGEEKITPLSAKYYVCTVEAMPRDLKVDFVAIDEVQLGSDLDRGHVFTDRILNFRGGSETLLLGAETIRPLLQHLLPGLVVAHKPRLSQLTYAGSKKISRLPPRSAVVAFSAAEVYAIAELIRRQKGGAAVVLGALSPRTRNAQVALYQNGDVDYLVATDAIGMGLNLDVDHIAFAQSRKFDGFQDRALTPAELGQIAGRAGRYKRDGTFGVTARQDEFAPELVQKLEAHDFAPLSMLQWRNSDLDFSSLKALNASLNIVPNTQGLTRAPRGEDQTVLELAMRDNDIASLAHTPEAVQKLWSACQIPDYRKLSTSAHGELCLEIAGFILRAGAIPDAWIGAHIEAANRLEGDIDTLSTRLAHMRTWAFVANRPDWVNNPPHWRERTRALEDQLSDALHQRLEQRFVDRRTSLLMRRLKDQDIMEAQIDQDGVVSVEGQKIGELQGFRFTADVAGDSESAKTLNAAAAKVLGAAIIARAQLLAEAPNDQLILSSDNVLRWKGQEVARLYPGESELEPELRLVADEHLTGAHREWVEARLKAYLRHHIATH
ncbi:MAG: helicase-related protein, partial [Pseudomonadota bacterium]